MTTIAKANLLGTTLTCESRFKIKQHTAWWGFFILPQMIQNQPGDRLASHPILQKLKAEKGIFWLVRIILPWILVVILSLYPIPSQLAGLFVDSQQAVNQKNVAGAADSIKLLAQFFTWRSDLWESAGNDYLTAGDYPNAIDCLLTAKVRQTLSITGLISLGDAYEQQGSFDQAIDSWNEASTRGASLAQIEPRLLHIYVLTGKDANALPLYTSWSGWDKNSAGDIYTLGVKSAIDLSDQAVSLLSKAAELDSDLQGKVNNIEAGIYASKDTDPAAYRVLLIGRALVTDDEWGLAKLAFEKATQDSPDYAEAWAYLGLAEDKLGVDGLPELTKAKEMKPDSVLIQALEAIYWTDHGKPDIAVVYLHAIAAQDPQNGLWQVELGYSLEMMGDLAAALPYYQQAVVVEPKNAAYWRDLADFSLKYNVQTKEIGLPAAREAIILDPQNAQGLDILAQFFIAEGDGASAERSLQKALSSDPHSAAIMYHLGLAYLQEGKTNSASQELHAALKQAQADNSTLTQEIQRTLSQYFP